MLGGTNMNKYLVIVLGKNYMYPMKVIMPSDEDLSKRVLEISKTSSYQYCCYKYLEKLDTWIPIFRIHLGVQHQFERCVVFNA